MKTYELKELIPSALLSRIESSEKWELRKNAETPWNRVEPYYLYNMVMDACVLKKGDALLDVFIVQEHATDGYTYTIETPQDGIWTIQLHHNEYRGWMCEVDKDVTIRYFENYDDIAEFLLSTLYEYKVIMDEFNGESHIEWKEDVLTIDGLKIFTNRNVSLGIEADLNGYYLKFIWSPDWRKRKDMGTGDTISILFDDNTKATFVAKTKPVKTNHLDNLCYTFTISRSIAKSLSSHDITAVKIQFANGDAPAILKSLDKFINALFRAWIRKNIALFQECGYKAGEEPSVEQQNSDASCFVYLMFDEANGYYKIGISNNPEYREHTLQSEKPTITLLKAKEYPTRSIAEAFEAALHKAYEAKRLRGEWFKLDATDVGVLIKALS